jgi:para-nitrobenzyl esterase
MSELTGDLIVRVSAGAVRGRTEGGIAVFRGIPFAAPPVGPRRFQAPEPAARWDGVRDADVFGPPPPQAELGPADPGTAPAGVIRHDEDDWLTLNVWTPDPGAAGLPVMFWIYGGAYRFGSSADPLFDGAALGRTGTVVVTANHRVGVEGFAELAGAPANRGLLDQVAALRWVQQEIAAFGGDPSRVTVFGESSGAGGVASLLVMPAAAGLFGQAIAQSVPGTFFSPALARDISAELVRPIGLEPAAAVLADIPPGKLLDAIADLDGRMPGISRWGLVAKTPTAFSPVVDGDVLPADPWTALAGGASAGVRLIAGHNRDEWRLFLALAGQAGAVTDEMATEAMELFGPQPDAGARIRRAYPDAGPEELFLTAYSDRMFRIPSLHLASAHTAGGGDSYLYELSWATPGAGGILGACHALDVPLVFGVLDQGLAALLIGSPPPAEAVDISGQMQVAWTAFARDGDPGWPAYDEMHQATRVFDIEGRGGIRAYPEDASRKLWAGTPIGVLGLHR